MIYFDNAATTFPKPDPVYDAVNDFIRNVGVSAGRSAYNKSVAASRIMFEVREQLAGLFGIKDASRIVFTSGATESLNLALLGTLKRGDRVVTSSFEHNSVMRPLWFLREERGVQVETVFCGTDGSFDLAQWELALRKRPAGAIVNHGSNVIGTIAPVIEIGAMCKRYGVRFFVDAAQTAGIVPIDVEEAGIDFLAFSGHKNLYGIQGTGGLYIREGCDPLPLKFGGTGSLSELDQQPLFLPDRYESGTQNLPGIVSLGAGAAFVGQKGVSAIFDHGKNLAVPFLADLRQLSNMRIHGPENRDRVLPTISITIDGFDNGIVAQRLNDEYDIALRAGLHCAPEAHRTMGTFPEGTIRISFGYFTTAEECGKLFLALKKISRS